MMESLDIYGYFYHFSGPSSLPTAFSLVLGTSGRLRYGRSAATQMSRSACTLAPRGVRSNSMSACVLTRTAWAAVIRCRQRRHITAAPPDVYCAVRRAAQGVRRLEAAATACAVLPAPLGRSPCRSLPYAALAPCAPARCCAGGCWRAAAQSATVRGNGQSDQHTPALLLAVRLQARDTRA